MQHNLSPKQLQVLSSLLSGASITAAARSAGIDRSTIYDWKRQRPFQDALTALVKERAESIREDFISLATDALGAVRSLLSDETAPPSIRLKAALNIIDAATQQPSISRHNEPITEEFVDRLWEAGFLAGRAAQPESNEIPQNPTEFSESIQAP